MTQPHLLPQNATPWERAVGLTNAQRYPLDHAALARFRNPWTAPADKLSWLAYQLGVDFWGYSWPEHTKRAMVAEFRELASLKGTPKALRRYLEIAGTPAVKMTLPPYGIYIGGDVEPEVYAAWLARLPQIRVYFDRQFPVLDRDTFLDLHHMDELLVTEDAGIRRRNHYATLYQDGLEVESISADVQPTSGNDLVRITINPIDVFGFKLDESYLDSEEDFIRPNSFFEQAVVASIDQSDLVADAGERSFETTLSSRPVSTKWSVITGLHPLEENDAFLDDAPADEALASNDNAYNRIYRRLYIHDPQIPMPVPPTGMNPEGMWLDMPPFYGIIKVDTRTPADLNAMIVGHSYEGYPDVSAGVGYLDAVEAVRRAQGATDVFAIDTKIEGLMTAGDRFTAGDRVRVGTLIERIN